MTRNQYYGSLCEAAMCIWEYALNSQEFMDWLATGIGAAAARQVVIDLLAEHCEISYILAKEWGYDDSFDWDFVTMYCNYLLKLYPGGVQDPLPTDTAVGIAKALTWA